MKKLQFYIGLMWKPVLVISIVIGILVGALSYRIDSHVQYTTQEKTYIRTTQSGEAIVQNPSFGPVSTIHYLSAKFGQPSAKTHRLVSISLAILSIALFYFVMRSWHTNRIAVLSTLLYATSSWFLVVSRLATPDIVFTLLPGIFLLRIWFGSTKYRRTATVICLVVAAITLYIPGGIWIVTCGLMWRGKKLISEVREAGLWTLLLASALSVGLLLPLIISLTKDVHHLYYLAGLPSTIPSPSLFLRNTFNVIVTLFYRADTTQPYTFGHSGLLDAATILLLILGVYAYIRRVRLDRAKLLLIGCILSLALVSLGGAVSITILLPFVYCFVAAGLAWLLQQWFTVFPKNPVARNVGLSFLAVMVAISVVYNLQRYYIAMPHIEKTSKVYNQRL